MAITVSASNPPTGNRVFGQQVSIAFEAADGVINYLGLIDNFQYQFDDVVKANAALSQAGKGDLDVLNDGGTGSFECKQADSILATFFINQAIHQRGGTTSFSNPGSTTAGLRGRTPYYIITQTTTFLDGNNMVLKFYGVLHNFSSGVSGNKEEVGEKWQFTFDYVEAAVTAQGAALNSETFGSFSDALDNILTREGGTVNPTSYYATP